MRFDEPAVEQTKRILNCQTHSP